MTKKQAEKIWEQYVNMPVDDFLFENHFEDGKQTLEQSVKKYVSRMPDWRDDVIHSSNFPLGFEKAILVYISKNQ